MSPKGGFLGSLLDRVGGKKHPHVSHTHQALQTLSTQYAYHADGRGYEFNNNLWGQDSADSGAQSTYYYGAPADEAASAATTGDAGGSGVSWGSTWSWTGGPDSVKSYVWVNRQFTRPLLSDVRALPTRAAWEYEGKRMRANVAYDIFTDKDPNHANSSGEYEIMIWLARYGGLGPISGHGKPLEKLTLAGHKFELHFGYNGSMKVYSFVAVDDIHDFRGDVLHFFKHLANKYSFPMSEQYMLIYQFGTEAVTGRDAEFYNSRFEADVIV